MPVNFNENILEGFEDENGARFFVFNILHEKWKNPLTNMMIAGLEIVGEAALATYLWRSNFHPAWHLIVSAMEAVSITHLYRNARKYYQKSPNISRIRLRLSCYLAGGLTAYFAGILCFSVVLKCNYKIWTIPCLGAAAIAYKCCVFSMTLLGRTVEDRSPFLKCCQLLFGPALVGSAGYFLLSFQQHEEEWVRCLPMITSAIVGGLITSSGYGRVESNNEIRWLLFKGLEILIGGCLILTNGTALLIYGVSKEFPPVYVGLFATMIFIGITDIINSLETFQQCVEVEEPVFRSICGMIGGQIVFTWACICMRCIGHPNLLPAFMVMAGAGLGLLGKSVKDLHELVPRPVFKRYCQRVLGPAVAMYSFLSSAYLGYRMRWCFSSVMRPFRNYWHLRNLQWIQKKESSLGTVLFETFDDARIFILPRDSASYSHFTRHHR